MGCWFLAVAGIAFLALFSKNERLRFGIWLLHRFMQGAGRIFGLDIRRVGALPEPGSLIVANHRSYIDVVAIGSVVPTGYLAKAEVGRWPFIGSGGRALGVLFVRRCDPVSSKAATNAVADRLADGCTMTNFPEGTTTAKNKPESFRVGLFHRVAGRPVTVAPLYISYEDDETDWVGDDWVGDSTFLGHLFHLAMRPSLPITLTFSTSLRADQYPDGEALHWR
jgi:1-acyl-sn-glycerol-3-phosphate acyltransferase